MKVLKTFLISVLAIFMVSSLSVFSYGQNNIAIDKEKLADLLDSPGTKQLLAKQFDGIPNINFDMDTMATDFFRTNIVVVTVDFEHIPTGKQGTASFAYRWKNLDFILLYYSHWFWGTVAQSYIDTDTTWTQAGSPYYVRDWMYVEEGTTLTIEPGTLVRVGKSNDYMFEIDVGGTLNCNGATFTTSCDFEEYDKSQVYYQDCDWYGIWVYGNGTCTIEDTVIEYASDGVFLEGGCTFLGNTIRRCSGGLSLRESNGANVVEDNILEDCSEGIYCNGLTSATSITGNTMAMSNKWYGWAGIYCYNSSPVISHNSISNFDEGIYCRESSPEVSNNTFQNNWDGILCNSGSSPVIHNNNFEGNYFGVNNWDDTVTIDAENNWWGDISGPFHPTDNPSGLGDEVSDYVDCDPWLTSVVTLAQVSSLTR